MEFDIIDLGLVDCNEARNFQNSILNEIISGAARSALILCRHNPVITMGRQAKEENILFRKEGIPVFQIERGGDVTYHGPGQLIAYPVFDLSVYKKDVHLFLRNLEETVISFLSDFGIFGDRIAGKTGVWVQGMKICSIGISVRKWVTFYGLSLNIKSNDLDNFALIRPCGMDVKMASLEGVLHREVDIEDVKDNLTDKFKSVFDSGVPMARAPKSHFVLQGCFNCPSQSSG